MTKNPLINASAAVVYISLVASVMFFGMRHTGVDNPDNSPFVPITMISLFTLSAAVMGYIFLSQPLQLYLDGKKKEAVRLFLNTLAVFGGFTVLALVLLISGIIR